MGSRRCLRKPMKVTSVKQVMVTYTAKREHSLDVMRVLACFLVVLTHSMMPNVHENGRYLGFLSFLCSPSSEMFLMLSGAILLPVKMNASAFYKRRFLKLLPPMMVWSLFGIILRYLQGKSTFPHSMMKMVLMPFEPVEGVYWFLYVMIGLYLFAPIISCWLRNASKRELEFFLCVWGLNMLLPWVNLLIPDFYALDGSYYWPLCYMGGFLGYWMLGFYLRRYSPPLFSVKGWVLVILTGFYAVGLVFVKNFGVSIDAFMDNLQIGSAILVALLFVVIKQTSESKLGERFLNRWCSSLAQYSFGIYLIHIYVVRDCVWLFFQHNRMLTHPILESLLIAILSMTLCVLLIMCVNCISDRLALYMFGYKRYVK